MKIIFFGSSNFAVPVLEALNEKEDVALVVTQPDRKKGRSLKLAPTAVKQLADSLKIKIFQPDNVNTKDSIQYLEGFDADIFAVVSFGQILKKELLSVPKKYCLNVHASLLPKYRGAAPINWAIANGEKETGITVIKMNERMDEGDMIMKEAANIADDDDAVTLADKLSKKAAALLLKTIDSIKSGKEVFARQDDPKATYAPRLNKQDGLIDWNANAGEIYNRVRAFVPWPGCFTRMNGKILKIWKARPASASGYSGSGPGTVLEIRRNSILVSAGKGAIEIEELQLEGKRRMKTEEFIAGHKELTPGLKFTNPALQKL